MNEQQFDALFRENLENLNRYLVRRVSFDEVQDLVSSIFEVAWRKRRQCPEGSELPWLLRIAALEIGNLRRKTTNRARIFSTLLEPNDAPSAESIAVADVSLSRAWRQLSAAEQRILALAAFEGFSPKELAVTLEISVNAASIRLHRAREKLRSLLDD